MYTRVRNKTKKINNERYITLLFFIILCEERKKNGKEIKNVSHFLQE